jgi:fumarate hydratase class II
MPIVTLKVLEAIKFTGNVISAFTEKCIIGIEADEARCSELVEKSLAMVTALAPLIGYDAAAAIAHEAVASGKTIREVAQSKDLLTPEQLDKALELEHDHAWKRKAVLSQHVQSFFFSVISRE